MNHRVAQVAKGSVLGERDEIPDLQINLPEGPQIVPKNFSPQSVSLVLYHTNEKTIRRPLTSIFPGHQHTCAASDATFEKYNNGKASRRAIAGQGLCRVHPRPHGVSGLGCPPRSRQRYPR